MNPPVSLKQAVSPKARQQVLDLRRASEQRQIDAAAIKALCQPFEDFLKGQK